MSQRDQDLIVQQQVKLDSRMRVLLGPACLHPYISAELAGSYIAAINTIDILKAPMPFYLIEAIYIDNRKSFAEIYTKHPLSEGYTIND